MKRTSLEQKMRCSQANRVVDAEVAKVFLERAAIQSLKEYYAGNHRFGCRIIRAVGMGKEWVSLWNGDGCEPLTYGRLCGMIAEKRQKGEPIDNLLLRAVVCRYAKNKMAELSRSAGENQGAAKTDFRAGVFQRESLESRLEKAKKTAIEEREQKKKEMQVRQRSLSDYYVQLEEGAESSGWCNAVVAGHINIREYFQALSLITGRADDAKMPEMLSGCENMTVEEVLDEERVPEEEYVERIYMLLIEPFGKIEAESRNTGNSL